MDFLDIKICEEFREVINETNIFTHDKEHMDKYNLICAVMDRVDSSVNYLNSNSEPPKKEDSLLFFIMYSCMILDAVKQLLKTLEVKTIYSDKDNPNAYIYFKKVCMGNPLNILETECPTDDKFFEYLRSLSMAHPFETSRPKFFKKGEIQYCPWVIANSAISAMRGISDGVGIRIYSNQFEEIQDLIFSFNILKKYINSRFLLMRKATEKVNQLISDKQQEWKKEKVTRGMPPIDTLRQVADILCKRYEEKYTVESAIEYLTCASTEPVNQQAVSDYQKAIIDLVPDVIQAVDDLDYNKLENTLCSVLSIRPNKMHNLAHYELEKIFCYLNKGDETSSNYAWGIQQANSFMKGFACKWVKIDTNTMSVEEIKLLVRVACYLEMMEQTNMIGELDENT